MTETILRATSPADLLAVPAYMLGFRPSESLVVLALAEKRVKFAARLDLVLDPAQLRHVATQVQQACSATGDGSVVLIGFSCDAVLAWQSVHDLSAALDADVAEALVTTGTHYWQVGTQPPRPCDATPHDDASSAVAVRAVYEGISIHGSRAEAVAAVQPPPAHEVPGIAERLDDAFAGTLDLAEDERSALLQQHIESETPLGPHEAAELACLLQDPELACEVLVHLDRDVAVGFRARLVEARRAVTEDFAPTVLGLLGIACWLAGEGAQQTDCIEQLARLEATHPLLRLLEAIHAGGVPPSAWEGWGASGP